MTESEEQADATGKNEAGGSSGAEQESSWRTASEQTRTAAKWLVSSLAAASAVVFGAGPILSRPNLSWRTDALQLSLAGLCGAVGLIGVILLVSSIGTVLIPQRVTLDTLPKELRDELRKNADERLPSDANSWAEFKKKLRLHNQVAADISATLHTLRSDEAREEDEIAAGTIREQIAALEGVQATAEENRKVYNESARHFLEDGAFLSIRSIFTERKKLIGAYAVMAALGGLLFQLALSSPTSPTSSTASDLAYLTELPSEDGRAAWAALGLPGCVNERGEVPVLLRNGKGTESDPYILTTVSDSERCAPRTMNLTNSLVALKKREATVVNVQVSETQPTQQN